MDIVEREITASELEEIYRDFERIEQRDGVPQVPRERYSDIAEEDGEVIGFASGLTHHKWFYLSDLWVKEPYRGKGLGSRLLEMLEEKVRALGIEHIYTWTSGPRNPRFYERHGYRAFTVFENFYEIEGYHQTGFRKDLVPPKEDGHDLI